VSELARAWTRTGAWAGIAVPGRFGADREPGVVITPRHDLSLACVIGRHDDGAALDRVFAEQYGIAPPYAPRSVCGASLDLVWAGPSQWLAVSVRPEMPAELASELDGVAAVTDQTDARGVLRLNGSHMRDALAKGCPVDLHGRVFRRGDTSTTAIGGIGVQIWWADVDDALHVAVPRSMAGSFWSWLMQSSQEFGVDVCAATRA
jgi:heterotetrameric sarcosine oxidase gamma subunit